MTTFWLLLSDLFKWSFQLFDFIGFGFNWIIVIAMTIFFVYWCVQVFKFGKKDVNYVSDTENNNPYYREDLYKQDGNKH